MSENHDRTLTTEDDLRGMIPLLKTLEAMLEQDRQTGVAALDRGLSHEEALALCRLTAEERDAIDAALSILAAAFESQDRADAFTLLTRVKQSGETETPVISWRDPYPNTPYSVPTGPAWKRVEEEER